MKPFVRGIQGVCPTCGFVGLVSDRGRGRGHCRDCSRSITQRHHNLQSRANGVFQKYMDSPRGRDVCRKSRLSPKGRCNQKKNSCIRRGIPFDLTPSVWENIPETCEICSKRMSNDRKSNEPQLDRIDPGEGYIPGNVGWICGDCNTKKSNSTKEFWVGLLSYLERHRG